MGMIRISDYAEEKIRKMAAESGRTVTSTVDALVEGNGGVDTSYFDKKFDELKSLITDSLVDVVAAGTGGGRAPGGKPGEKEWVPWDQMSYIIFTHEDDDPAWIIPEASVFQFKNGDPTAYAYYVKDNVIFMESVGRPEPLIKVTPEIREAIDERKTYD